MQGNEKFLGRVASYAHKHALWREGERILAAVSGGPDSLALLLALKLLAVKEKNKHWLLLRQSSFTGSGGKRG